MALLDVPERLLQRHVHALLTDPTRTWRCTNGEMIQIVAAGLTNVHAGPDFQDMAVLCNGVVYIGDGEFHRRASEWSEHNHTSNERYQNLLLHVVIENNTNICIGARWTLEIPAHELAEALRNRTWDSKPTTTDIEEVQHFALLRLLRQTADAQSTMRRLGVKESLRVLLSAWLSRLSAKRLRPMDDAIYHSLRSGIVDSAYGHLVQNFPNIPACEVYSMVLSAERVPIGREGPLLRREVFVNVILPMLCTLALPDQRIVLLQWYWSAPAVHEYGLLRRRFHNQSQKYVWQQQGLLEFMRTHGRRLSTCGEAIRAYGVSGTLEFIREAMIV